MAEDNEKKNLEETKLTNEKLGQLKSAIDESAEDAEFARQEAAANASDEIGGSEESQQEEKAANKANIDAEAKQTSILQEISKNGKAASKEAGGAGDNAQVVERSGPRRRAGPAHGHNAGRFAAFAGGGAQQRRNGPVG